MYVFNGSNYFMSVFIIYILLMDVYWVSVGYSIRSFVTKWFYLFINIYDLFNIIIYLSLSQKKKVCGEGVNTNLCFLKKTSKFLCNTIQSSNF